MKKTGILLALTFSCFAYANWFNRNIPAGKELVPIPPSTQRNGNPAAGFDYLVNGDYLKSGISYRYFRLINGADTRNNLNRAGKAAYLPYNFNLVKKENGQQLVAPNCLQCHAQVFGDSLYLGLGNSTIDFTVMTRSNNRLGKMAQGVMQLLSPQQYAAAQPFMHSFNSIAPLLRTEARGVNAADRLATVLVAHRNPQTLRWSDTPLLDIPDKVVPTDVPAWWLLRKKNAMFYNGFGRGDFAKFLMLSNLLTVTDSTEAREVSTHFPDVLAYIRSLRPPPYPQPVNKALAMEGEIIFIDHCSKCHGHYGENEYYPNLLVPEKIIQTDSLLFKSNYQNPQFIDWFNQSWYATTDHPARLQPFNGYIAPPLDGIWITAPYLHNGSVPTLEAVLNSKLRPTYWKRSFRKPAYDYDSPGWKYTRLKQPGGRKTYNTRLPGYSNAGHYFGDQLSDTERRAVIEYLKTL